MNTARGVMLRVWRRGEGGKFGDGGALQDHEIGPCLIEWTDTDDAHGGPAAGDSFRDADYSEGRVFAPVGSDVIAIDLIEYDSVRYRLRGKPVTQRFAGSGCRPNLVFRIREVT
ncbi:hypothetical protein IU500_12410 [Nocardia terpenica]|uniref:hypothetical protein n=1 Tax=Nocardia terpenica TaxID=455432 RepID=UPI001892EE8C|nr:hypothetical protein [Nocardia terpenica]MBF6063020.1 hypothetical protein [Nocardia terpenica]MBF6104845.1 hypothetical protein [Nocardia terpenica]MBF6112718.1 hypothetical protein [Nocardia terpenica]MBF6118573.1 hypothetical protein [Nocardia terpenica]MBF6155052.1 hypothetical protein [Nocardia terpenica]